MARKRNPRPYRQRRSRKMFVISTEGAVTEPEYFDAVKRLKVGPVVNVKCLRSNHQSNPRQVLKRVRQYLQEVGLETTDEAWLVVDTDNWSATQLKPLYEWSQEDPRYGLAVSNPNIEYWLLLHFEDVRINSKRQCTERLRRHVHGYDKHIDFRITRAMVESAVTRAKQRDRSQSQGWPQTTGTTLYRLVKSILTA